MLHRERHLSCLDISENDLRDSVSWLNIFKEPETRLFELWKHTAKSRLMFIHPVDKEKKPSLNDIIERWPRLHDAKGYVLVCIAVDYLPSKFSSCTY